MLFGRPRSLRLGLELDAVRKSAAAARFKTPCPSDRRRRLAAIVRASASAVSIKRRPDDAVTRPMRFRFGGADRLPAKKSSFAREGRPSRGRRYDTPPSGT